MHKFIMENDYQEQLQTKVEFTVPSEADLTDMCEQFTLFLKACGYSIPEGEYLDFTPEDGYSSEGWDSMETATEDFNPRNPLDTPPDIGKKKLWDATPEEWNNAYQNVTVKYKEHD